MKSYIGKQQFGGVHEEDIDERFKVFEALAAICQESDVEIMRALPIMWKSDAFSPFSKRSNEHNEYP